ncbi:MAG: hypothetical protein E6J88_14550 [Deltaproteobacteria bacterium]|nr:MAG: hypothetical protein E6J88_14550 [Deltaproteobacteria bacterium]
MRHAGRPRSSDGGRRQLRVAGARGAHLSTRRLLLLAGHRDRDLRAQRRRRADVRSRSADLQPHPVRRPARPCARGARWHRLRPQ